jgi:hypothetical protein
VKLTPYPLALPGFTPSDRAAIVEACLRVGAKLARYTGLSAWATYCRIFYGIRILPNHNIPGDYHGKASIYLFHPELELVPGFVNVELVVHELGHVFDGVSREIHPSEAVAWNWIRGKDGKSVHGKPAPRNGFRSDEWGKDRQHPQRWDKVFSYTEDFADMFMCWVLHNLADNEAGDARKAWMDEHVKEWVG